MLFSFLGPYLNEYRHFRRTLSENRVPKGRITLLILVYGIRLKAPRRDGKIMPDGDVDTERTVVKTYVPAYQKERWQRQADELEMSQSEFVRTMVQAGRRGFEGFDDEEETEPKSGSDSETQDAARNATRSRPTAPDDRIDEHVVTRLSSGEYRSWETLRDDLASELVDERLEDALQRLQRENRVQYSGRHGGYTLVEQP